MRLWHEDLIKKLPRQQLLGQHREASALRGKGWGKNHSTVNYVFDHSIEDLVSYHHLIMDEMESRGYNVSVEWRNPNYRGKLLGYVEGIRLTIKKNIYAEHDELYLLECVENLRQKGIEI
jgi:uncharacterized protein (TIGR02328 family)